ncbi:MAG TPA: hypothetical protein VG366_04510 [Solirubrobacteraceae bacterium]|jgi:hypothetical protein|nr:hypothetical protein [Solirubrobacteraceae bacterium]
MNSAAQADITAAKRYSSLVSFYNGDPDRLSSREQDVGLWWRDDVDGPLHRAAWVRETGELYLVRLGPQGEGGGSVEVLARVETAERLERMLRGWRERCGAPGSLRWLRGRVAPARVSARRRPLRAHSTVGALA